MLSGSVAIATELVYEFLRASSIVSIVAILNRFNHKMSASDPNSLEYTSLDDGSFFEGFTAADIRESERSVTASAALQGKLSGVGAVDGDSSGSSASSGSI